MPRKDCSGAISVQNSISEDVDFPAAKSHRHPKSLKECSYREKEIKVVRSVCKELSGQAFQSKINKFQPGNGLLDRKVVCKGDQVSIKFSSPLSGISSPVYVKKWRCEEMISEEEQTPNNNHASVVAVALNWRKGVKVEQLSMYSRQTKFVEPKLTTTDFDFESKIKFQKQLQSEISDLFPQNDVKLLDGNECHGRVTIKSKDILQEGYNSFTDGVGNPSGDIYDDQEEHKVILVPFHSKAGFDADVTKRYSFPYHAKFTVNKKNYEHHFQLHLLPCQSPQHFGLIFTFIPSDGCSVTVKSLLSVHSLFPTTPRHAYLVTYTDTDAPNAQPKSKSNDKKGYKREFVKNVNETVLANLSDEKLVNGSAFRDSDRPNEFSVGCNFAHPQYSQRFFGSQRSYFYGRSNSETSHRQKGRIAQGIRADAYENGDVDVM